MTLVDAILQVLGTHAEGEIITTATVRDAVQPLFTERISLDRVGHILAGLGLEKVRKAQRRGWVTRAGTKMPRAGTDNTPVNTSLEETQMFSRVKNLTGNYITLVSPDKDITPPTLLPYETRDLDADLFDVKHQAGRDNVAAQKMGYFEIVEVMDDFDPMIDSGRRAALAAENQLPEPGWEALAQQILLYPLDDIENQSLSLNPKGTEPRYDVMASMIDAMLNSLPMKEPQKGAGYWVDWETVAKSLKPWLENVLKREKLWRNRPAIIEAIESRIQWLVENCPQGFDWRIPSDFFISDVRYMYQK